LSLGFVEPEQPCGSPFGSGKHVFGEFIGNSFGIGEEEHFIKAR
jgi:hypothetical protein